MEPTASSTSSRPADAAPSRRAGAPARRALEALAPPIAAGLIRATWSTCAIDWIRPGIVDSMLAGGRPFVLAFWHCKLWLMQYALRGRSVTALISRHGDGELIARTMSRFGHAAARGSSTRAGGSLAITPDGPKGPACECKAGVVEIARATGLPILPVSLAASRVRRLDSWDRFELVLPFSRIAVAYGEPMACPREATEEDRERLRLELGRRLDALGLECESSVAR